MYSRPDPTLERSSAAADVAADVAAGVADARRLRGRERLLLEAGALLASSLDYDTTIRQLVRLAVPAFADWAAYNVPEPDGGLLRTVAIHHADPSRVRSAQMIGRRFRMRLDDAAGAGRVVRTGEPELVPDLPDSLLAAVARDAEHLALLRDVGVRSLLTVPLVAHGRILGALGFGTSESGRRFDADDLAFAQELARRAAHAIDNARLYAAERAARERTERLQRVTAALAEAATAAQVAEVIVHEAVPAVDADAGTVALLGADDTFTLLAEVGLPPAFRQAYERFAAHPALPPTQVAATGAAVVVRDLEEWDARYPPDVAAAARRMGYAGYAALPLVLDGRVHGVVAFSFRGPCRLTPDALDFMRTLVAQGAQAMERARLLDAARRSADLARRLQDVTAALSSALTPDAVAAVVVDGGMAALGAPLGSLALLDGAATFRLVCVRGFAEALARGYARFPCEAGRPVSDAVLGRAPVLLESPAAIARGYPYAAGALQAEGAQAYAAVPLLAGATALGALSLAFRAPVSLDGPMAGFLTALGEVAGQALERARLYAGERAAREAAEAARAEAEAARGEAVGANRAKSEFLAVMSHELRTPLNAIAGYTQLLALGLRGPVTPEQLADLERIRRSQHHLLALINDVLNFAKLEAGRVELRAAAVPLAELLADVRDVMLPQMAARGIAFACDDAPRGLVRADAEKARQVLLNLLSNAAKFTAPGGHVAVEVELRDGAAAVHVRDDGPGIAADQLERVFEPFVQLDRSLTRAHDGSGLGLAISRELAERMGGTLTASSTPGEGSTFTLALPRPRAQIG